MFNSNIGFHITSYGGYNAKTGRFYITEDSFLKNYFSEDQEYVAISETSIKKGECITLKFGGVLKPSRLDRCFVNEKSSVALSIADCNALTVDREGDFVFLVKIKDGEKK